MTPSQLLSLANEARARAGKATKAETMSLRPSVDDFGIDIIVVECREPKEKGQIASFDREADADFFVSARLAVPVLAEAVIALMPYIAHKPMCYWILHGTDCDCGLSAALASLGKDAHGR